VSAPREVGWLKRQMQPATRDKMLAALDEYEARSCARVAAITGDSVRTTYVKLHLMFENGWVWREPLHLFDTGGVEWLYLKIPEEVASAPLYDRQPGWDTLALARCFDLHTYRKHAILHAQKV